jgi:glycosyltransferase involved in cell wall biosynthesis
MRVSFPPLVQRDGRQNRIRTGKHNFLSRLIPELEKLGVECVQMEDDSDIKFHFVKYDPRVYGKFKNVIRLDGVNVEKGSNNVAISASHSQADGIAYQSQFSKRCCNAFLSKPKDGAVTDIINNGASTAFYDVIEPSVLKQPYNIFCSSRRGLAHKRIPETISIFERIKRDDIGLVIAGKVPTKSDHPRIIYTGSLTDEELGAYYKACNMMLFMSWIDNCPNTIVEALCAGLWCVVSNEGGTNELINDSVGKVFEVDPEFPYKPVNTNKPPKISEADKDRIARYIESQIDRPVDDGNFDNSKVRVENVAKRYKTFFERVLS